MDVDSERERHWWNAKAPREEQDLGDEAINRALRWREIERHLDGVQTILEVGGGTGAFSIPLARRGFAVTHLDLSPAMIQIARQGLARQELAPQSLAPQQAQDLNIRFVEANAADLSQFADRSFDLVLNMDGAVSFAGSMAEQALAESCRVARKALIVTVSHRARLLPVWVEGSLAVLADFAPAVDAMLDRGEWHQGQFPENPLLTQGMTQDYMGVMRAFLPGEVRDILEGAGMTVLRCGGLGSLAGFCGQDTVERVLQDEDLFDRFLDLCERFDREVLPDGPGTRQRAGLIAVGQRVAPD